MAIQLSYSANQRYQMSPRSYYLHYVLRLRPEKTGSALVFGNAMDTGLNALLMGEEDYIDKFEKEWKKVKLNGKKIDLSRDGSLVKYSKADYDESILLDSDKIMIEAGLDQNWVSLRRKGLMMLEAYKEQVIPKIEKVYAVQRFVSMKNEDGDSFIGFVDAIIKFKDDPKIYICDNKTSSIKYKETSVKESAQLATYFEAVEDIEVSGACYIVIPKKVRKVKEPRIEIDIIKDDINEALLEETFEQYESTLKGIKLGEFPCTGCKENVFGCDYRRFCESNGEDTTGLVYVKKSEMKNG